MRESRFSPHTRSDLAFFLADGVGIDGGRGYGGMAQPFLHHIEGNVVGDGCHAVAVPQSFRGRGAFEGNPGALHYALDGASPSPG